MSAGRALFLMLVLLAPVGCGFQLRSGAMLPPGWTTMAVQTPDRYGALQQELELVLQSRAVRIDPTAPRVLRITEDRLAREALSFGPRGRVSEYRLRYRVGFDLIGSDGRTLLPTTYFELEREYGFDEAQALAAADEEALLQSEMRRELVELIVQRLSRAASD